MQIQLWWAYKPVLGSTFLHQLLSCFMTAKGYFWWPKWQKGHICWLSHWGGWVQKPGLGATLLSEIFPCDWKGAEKGHNWVWRLKCPFCDLTVTELPSSNWRLFPPSNLQSPEFNSPESITAHEEGAWLMQQLQTAPATAFRDPL